MSLNAGGHPCDVYQHCQPNENGYVILYLHGIHGKGLADQPAFLEQFDRYGLDVVCPQTGRSWWADRICPEFDPDMSAETHVLKNVLRLVEERFGARPPRIGLLGTSMGGQGALRFAYKFPETFPVVAAISPAIDFQIRLLEGDKVLAQMYDDPEQARQDTAILHLHPLNWPRQQFFCCDPTDARWFDSAERLEMKLASLGVPHQCDLETVGGGHGFGYYNVMAERAVNFLVQGLERERLRLA